MHVLHVGLVQERHTQPCLLPVGSGDANECFLCEVIQAYASRYVFAQRWYCLGFSRSPPFRRNKPSDNHPVPLRPPSLPAAAFCSRCTMQSKVSTKFDPDPLTPCPPPLSSGKFCHRRGAPTGVEWLRSSPSAQLEITTTGWSTRATGAYRCSTRPREIIGACGVSDVVVDKRPEQSVGRDGKQGCCASSCGCRWQLLSRFFHFPAVVLQPNFQHCDAEVVQGAMESRGTSRGTPRHRLARRCRNSSGFRRDWNNRPGTSDPKEPAPVRFSAGHCCFFFFHLREWEEVQFVFG